MRLSPKLVRIFLPSRIREQFYEALAAYLDNRLNLIDCLALMRRHTPKGVWVRETFLDLTRARLAAGQSFSQTLRDMIPGAECMIIASGETAGTQAQSLRLAADMVRTRREVLDSVGDALTYPLFLMMLFAGLLLTVALFVVPSLAGLIPLNAWQGSAQVLHRVSDFVASWRGLGLAAAVLAGAGLAVYSLPRWTGPGRRAMDNLPPWSLYRLVVSGMWLFTLATLIRGGVRTARALELTRDNGACRWLQARIEAVRGRYARGKDLGDALADSDQTFLEQALLDEFRLYAALPDFHDKIQDLTRQWLTGRVRRLRQTCRRINVFSIFLILMLLSGVGLAVAELVLTLSHGMSFM
jgi:type II secretory pathway component PulF